MAAAPPDYALLAQHVIAAGEQIALIPNAPLAADQFVQLDNRIEQLAQQQAQTNIVLAQQQGLLAQQQALLAQINDTLQQMNVRLGRLEDSNTLLPIRLINMSASLHAPLQFPGGVVVPPFLVLKGDILKLTIAQCNNISQAFQLPALPGVPTVNDRRRQISDYLGAGLVVQ